MEFVIGILGVLLLGTLYVGFGLADRGRESCHDCSLASSPQDCETCPLVVAAGRLDEELERETDRSPSTMAATGDRTGGSGHRELPMWKRGAE